MVSPVWSPHTATVGHTCALAKQWPQTVRIETIAGQLSTHGRDDNSLFSLPRYFFPAPKARGGNEVPARQRCGPGFLLLSDRTCAGDGLASSSRRANALTISGK
jgi:hypothetical protein